MEPPEIRQLRLQLHQYDDLIAAVAEVEKAAAGDFGLSGTGLASALRWKNNTNR